MNNHLQIEALKSLITFEIKQAVFLQSFIHDKIDFNFQELCYLMIAEIF